MLVTMLVRKLVRSLRFRVTHAFKRLSPPASLPYLYIAPAHDTVEDDFDTHKLVLIVCLGQQEAQVADLVRQCKYLAEGGLKTVLAADFDSPQLFCDTGLFIERLVPRREWSSRVIGTPWEDYFNHRMREIKKYYRPTQTIFSTGGEDIATTIASAAESTPATQRR